jgi:hypothetical protein
MSHGNSRELVLVARRPTAGCNTVVVVKKRAAGRSIEEEEKGGTDVKE